MQIIRVIKKLVPVLLISLLFVGYITSITSAIPLNPPNPILMLHNDYNDEAVEAMQIDESTTHYEYEEEIERGEVEQEIQFEIDELSDIEERIVEQKLESLEDKEVKKNKADPNPRTNFFSYKKNTGFQQNIFSDSSNFFYFHQLPPGVDPDVGSAPFFNYFDFTRDLIEFELEIEGWTTDNPKDSAYEVRIMHGETFEMDINNRYILSSGSWEDVGVLGSLNFGDSEHGRYEFELEFEQYNTENETDSIFISPEIYVAIEDGILGIHIARVSGSGNLFLEESEFELEQLTAIPEPASGLLLSFGLGSFVLICSRKKLAV